MIAGTSVRIVAICTVLLFALTACSREEDESTARLEAAAYLNVAEIYQGQGQFRAGIIEAQNALQAFPAYNEARRFVARLYMEIGDNSSALELLENLLSADPDDTEAALLLSEAQLNTGNPNLALETLATLTALSDADQVQAYWITANAHARLNNSIAAQESLYSALEINDTHAPSLLTLSILEFQSGNEFGAQQFLERAQAADPDSLDVLIWQGQLALLAEDYAESEAAFFQALQIMGEYDTMTAKRLSVIRAIILPLQMQQKNAEALRYSQIIEETPQGQFENSFTTAMSMFQEGNYEQAEQALAALLSQAPEHAGSNILLGLTQYAQGNLQGAEANLEGFVNAESSSPEVIKVLAATHLRLGQSDRALTNLQQAAEQYPDDSSILAMLAITERSLGNADRAIELFQRAIGLDSGSADLHFSLAGSYFDIEDNESAIEELKRTLELEPEYTQAKTTLINLLVNLERADEAGEFVDSWLQQDADSTTNNNVAGRLQFNQGDFDAARTYFEKSLELDSENLEARLFLARIAVQSEDYVVAQEQYLLALAGVPSNLEALSGMLALGDVSDTSAQKIAAISRIIEENANEFIPALVLAQYHMLRSEFTQARPHAQTAYARNVNDFTENTLLEITFQLASQARANQELDRAQALTAEALELQPDNIQVMILAAGLQAQLGDFDAAMSYIDRIKEIQPQDSTLGIELEGDLAVEQLEYDTALEAFQRAWDIAATPGLGIKIHSTLSTLERSDEAHQFLENWVADSPEDFSANLLLGMSLQQSGEDGEATAAYEIAISQQADNIVALNNLAWLYQDTDPERALELATRAAELYPENSDVLDTYGWILLKQDSRDHAIQVLERALELSPDSTAIAEHLEQARQ